MIASDGNPISLFERFNSRKWIFLYDLFEIIAVCKSPTSCCLFRVSETNYYKNRIEWFNWKKHSITWHCSYQYREAVIITRAFNNVPIYRGNIILYYVGVKVCDFRWTVVDWTTPGRHFRVRNYNSHPNTNKSSKEGNVFRSEETRRLN